MFNDRDLIVLAAGAILAMLALFLPFGLLGRMVVGVAVLAIFMLLALLRVGPDRVTLEEWLRRRLRFALRPRRYVYKRGDLAPPTPPPSAPAARAPAARAPGPRLSLAVDDVGVEPLLTAAMAVLGVYLMVWLAQGGAEDLGRLWRRWL